MEHISNMGHSLDAIKYIVNLHVAIGSPLVDIHYKETYPFRDEDAYKQEVMEYRIKYDREDLNKILKQHLSTCEQIIKAWEVERLELWEARSILKAGRKNDINDDISYEIYCTLGGRRNNIMRFYGDVMLLRKNNGKVEIGNPYTYFDMLWREYDPDIHSIPNTDKTTLTVHLVRFAKDIKSFLNECFGKEEDKPQLNIPDPILSELEKENLIVSREPLQWHTQKIALCAYFVDSYFAKTNPNNLWVVGQMLFNVRNLAQSKNNYLGNKSGKPRGYQVIDKILKKQR